MGKTFHFLAAISLLLLCAAMPEIAHAEVSGLIAPDGLTPCAPDDPVVVGETRIAGSLGGHFLGCFHSEKSKDAQVATKYASSAPEYAFALRLAGESHSPADIDKLLATVSAQWKDFHPLNEELPDKYVASINDLVKNAGITTTRVTSIKPVLVSIDRLDANSYSVTTIRSYAFAENGGETNTTMVNSGAVVLCGQELIRLNVQRALTNATDVAQLRSEISEWAKAVENTSAQQNGQP